MLLSNKGVALELDKLQRERELKALLLEIRLDNWLDAGGSPTEFFEIYARGEIPDHTKLPPPEPTWIEKFFNLFKGD